LYRYREVERIARNMGATKRMGFVEFQMLVARFPQIFQPAEILYRLMNANSGDAGKAGLSLRVSDCGWVTGLQLYTGCHQRCFDAH
jgi:hypothetical protein